MQNIKSDMQKNESSSLAIISDVPFKIERAKVPIQSSSKTHHYHDSYELYYLYSGDRHYFIKDKTYHIKRGNLVLIKQYDIHSTSSYQSGGYERILINFKKSFLSSFLPQFENINLFECFEKDIHVIQLNFREQRFVEGLLLSMLEEYSSKEHGYEYFLKTAMLQLLLLVSRYSGQRDEESESYISSAHKTVSEVAAYINNNYMEDITLEDISERFFISQYYFSRMFKKITGISFVDYIGGVRIKEAQRLLKKSDMSISEVALAVGYKSSTHFGRSFKRIFGVSPMTYRKRGGKL